MGGCGEAEERGKQISPVLPALSKATEQGSKGPRDQNRYPEDRTCPVYASGMSDGGPSLSKA